jgi:cell division protein FtsB
LVKSLHPPFVTPLQCRRTNLWLRRALILAAAIALVDALVGERSLAQTLRARQDYQQEAAALSALRRENAGLREEARRLAEDPARIESIARGQLGFVRPGELLIILKR